jgi:hypothetical protein
MLTDIKTGLIYKIYKMKKTYSFSLILLLLIVSCKKPTDFYNELGKGTTLTLVKQNNGLLNAVDPISSVSIVINFNGSPVESVNLYVATSPTKDKTKWKLIKNIPFSGETTISATNAEIAKALGLTPGALSPGSVFDLYNEAVTKDGRKFSSANTSDIDLENQPAFNTAFHWTATVVCPFSSATVNGTYKVIQDDWQDWNPGQLVQVTLGSTSNTIDISQVWPNPVFGQVVTPLTFTVDKDGIVTVPTGVVWGNYGTRPADETKTLAGSTGFVFSCTGVIDIKVHFSYGGSDQGFPHLILKKQ